MDARGYRPGEQRGAYPRRIGCSRGGTSRPQAYLPHAPPYGPHRRPAGLLEWSPDAELGTTEHEAEIVSGSRRLDERPNRIVRALDRRLQLSAAPVGKVLREGDLVSGFRVILTPGHTSGHASLLRDEDGLLFAGDAFGAVALRRIRVGVVKIFCTDPSLAKRSAEKLLQEEFDTVVMSHGKPLYTGARQELREAVARCNYG